MYGWLYTPIWEIDKLKKNNFDEHLYSQMKKKALKFMYDAHITEKFWRYSEKWIVDIESQGRVRFEILQEAIP